MKDLNINFNIVAITLAILGIIIISTNNISMSSDSYDDTVSKNMSTNVVKSKETMDEELTRLIMDQAGNLRNKYTRPGYELKHPSETHKTSESYNTDRAEFVKFANLKQKIAMQVINKRLSYDPISLCYDGVVEECRAKYKFYVRTGIINWDVQTDKTIKSMVQRFYSKGYKNINKDNRVKINPNNIAVHKNYYNDAPYYKSKSLNEQAQLAKEYIENKDKNYWKDQIEKGEINDIPTVDLDARIRYIHLGNIVAMTNLFLHSDVNLMCNGRVPQGCYNLVMIVLNKDLNKKLKDKDLNVKDLDKYMTEAKEYAMSQKQAVLEEQQAVSAVLNFMQGGSEKKTAWQTCMNFRNNAEMRDPNHCEWAKVY